MFKETASFKSTWNKKILKTFKNIRYELRRMNEIGIAAEKNRFYQTRAPTAYELTTLKVNQTAVGVRSLVWFGKVWIFGVIMRAPAPLPRKIIFLSSNFYQPFPAFLEIR